MADDLALAYALVISGWALAIGYAIAYRSLATKYREEKNDATRLRYDYAKLIQKYEPNECNCSNRRH